MSGCINCQARCCPEHMDIEEIARENSGDDRCSLNAYYTRRLLERVDALRAELVDAREALRELLFDYEGVVANEFSTPSTPDPLKADPAAIRARRILDKAPPSAAVPAFLDPKA